MKKVYSQTREELLLKLFNRKEPQAYCKTKKRCVYSHSINGGCAIGVEIDSELANELDKYKPSGILNSKVFEQLPKRLQNMGQDFLDSVQSLHDDVLEHKESSPQSFIERFNSIILEYELDLKPFKISDIK